MLGQSTLLQSQSSTPPPLGAERRELPEAPVSWRRGCPGLSGPAESAARGSGWHRGGSGTGAAPALPERTPGRHRAPGQRASHKQRVTIPHLHRHHSRSQPSLNSLQLSMSYVAIGLWSCSENWEWDQAWALPSLGKRQTQGRGNYGLYEAGLSNAQGLFHGETSSQG